MPRIPRRPWSNSCITRPRAWRIACRRRSSSCMRTGFPQHFMASYFGNWWTNGWNGLADFLTNTWLAEIHCFFVDFADLVTFPKNVLRWQELQHEQESMDREMKREQEQRGLSPVRDKAKWRLHEQTNRLSWVVIIIGIIIIIIIIIHHWTTGPFDHCESFPNGMTNSNPSSILRRACGQPRNSISRRSSAEFCALNRWRWECIMTIHRMYVCMHIYIYTCIYVPIYV